MSIKTSRKVLLGISYSNLCASYASALLIFLGMEQTVFSFVAASTLCGWQIANGGLVRRLLRSVKKDDPNAYEVKLVQIK